MKNNGSYQGLNERLRYLRRYNLCLVLPRQPSHVERGEFTELLDNLGQFADIFVHVSIVSPGNKPDEELTRSLLPILSPSVCRIRLKSDIVEILGSAIFHVSLPFAQEFPVYRLILQECCPLLKKLWIDCNRRTAYSTIAKPFEGSSLLESNQLTSSGHSNRDARVVGNAILGCYHLQELKLGAPWLRIGAIQPWQVYLTSERLNGLFASHSIGHVKCSQKRLKQLVCFGLRDTFLIPELLRYYSDIELLDLWTKNPISGTFFTEATLSDKLTYLVIHILEAPWDANSKVFPRRIPNVQVLLLGRKNWPGWDIAGVDLVDALQPLTKIRDLHLGCKCTLRLTDFTRLATTFNDVVCVSLGRMILDIADVVEPFESLAPMPFLQTIAFRLVVPDSKIQRDGARGPLGELLKSDKTKAGWDAWIKKPFPRLCAFYVGGGNPQVYFPGHECFRIREEILEQARRDRKILRT